MEGSFLGKLLDGYFQGKITAMTVQEKLSYYEVRVLHYKEA